MATDAHSAAKDAREQDQAEQYQQHNADVPSMRTDRLAGCRVGLRRAALPRFVLSPEQSRPGQRAFIFAAEAGIRLSAP